MSDIGGCGRTFAIKPTGGDPDPVWFRTPPLFGAFWLFHLMIHAYRYVVSRRRMSTSDDMPLFVGLFRFWCRYWSLLRSGSGEVLADSLAHLIGAVRENINISRAQVSHGAVHMASRAMAQYPQQL